MFQVTSMPVMSQFQLSCWPKGPYRKPQNNLGYCWAIGYSPENNGKELLMKTKLIHIIEHGKLELLPLLTTIHSTGRQSKHSQKRKVKTNPVTNPIFYNSEMPARFNVAIMEQNLWK